MNALAAWKEAGGQAVENAVVLMERRGVALDIAYCHSRAEIARTEEAAQLVHLREILGGLGIPPLPGADLIWSSPKQLVTLFHSPRPLGLDAPPSPVWKKGRVKLTAGQRKLDEKALKWVGLRRPDLRPLCRGVVRLRRIRGAVKYFTKLPGFVGPDGRLHPVCGPAGDRDEHSGTVTGRLAVKKPELQQMPSDEKKDWLRVRRAFVAEPGNALVVADYRQLEVVILAHIILHLFGDEQLAEMCRMSDIHAHNARRVFGEHLSRVLADGRPVAALDLSEFKTHPEAARYRHMIKEIWYGLMYGKGAWGFGASLTDQSGDPIGEERAGVIMNALLDSVPGIRRYQGWVGEFILKHRGIPSLAGRWCDLRRLLDERTDQSEARAWRRALNFPMQAGGADIMGRAMVSVTEDPELAAEGFALILQVHDELILEGPADRAAWAAGKVKALMENAWKLLLPLTVSVEVGPNWEDTVSA